MQQNNRPALLILAAGMGSRYGGLKQLDGIGPNGETIMDYSVYDAIQAGFGQVVFVIRHSFEKEFREKILAKYESLIPTSVVFQETEKLPDGYTCPERREKPWGTGHAVQMGAEVIDVPFAVINADDFYGRHSFEVLADELRSVWGRSGLYSMVGFELGRTLSESGAVSRGVCSTNSNGDLMTVVEHTGIEQKKGVIGCPDPTNPIKHKDLRADTIVSMNMWGFTPDYFAQSELLWKDFLDHHIHEPESEFYIPYVVSRLIENRKASVKVLHSDAQWFGVTYAADRPMVQSRLHGMYGEQTYPNNLFSTTL